MNFILRPAGLDGTLQEIFFFLERDRKRSWEGREWA